MKGEERAEKRELSWRPQEWELGTSGEWTGDGIPGWRGDKGRGQVMQGGHWVSQSLDFLIFKMK